MRLTIQTIHLPPTCDRLILCGGPYGNVAAVETFLSATATVPQRFCLGDLGGFGPDPDRTIALLRTAGVICLQGNYDYAVGHGEAECGCGYQDPRDREFAQISYDYTLAHTSPAQRQWLTTLPQLIRLEWGDRAILLCHGSPDQVNAFVWESTTSTEQIRHWLTEWQVDGICATHSGLPWLRTVAHPDREQPGFWLNVGVLGRPAHDGQHHVYYASLTRQGDRLQPQLLPLPYDVQATVTALQAAGLPPEFWQALEQGIWTTCATVLPPAEQAVRSRTPTPVSTGAAPV